MSIKKKIGIAVIVLAAMGMATTALFLYNQQKDHRQKETSQTSLSSQPPEKPAVPTGGQQSKRACALFTEEVAARIIGDAAVRNERVTAFATAAYSSSVCEYTVNSKKANVILYTFANDQSAAANKTKAETEETVASPDGKTTSIQPRQSVAGVKGKYVVSAAVTNGGGFDARNSQQLLEEALKKL